MPPPPHHMAIIPQLCTIPVHQSILFFSTKHPSSIPYVQSQIFLDFFTYQLRCTCQLRCTPQHRPSSSSTRILILSSLETTSGCFLMMDETKMILATIKNLTMCASSIFVLSYSWLDSISFNLSLTESNSRSFSRIESNSRAFSRISRSRFDTISWG